MSEEAKVKLADIISQLQRKVNTSNSSPPFLPKDNQAKKEEAVESSEIIVHGSQIIIDRPPVHMVSLQKPVAHNDPTPNGVAVYKAVRGTSEDNPDGHTNIMMAKQKLRAWGNVKVEQNSEELEAVSNGTTSLEKRDEAKVDPNIVFNKQQEAIVTLRRKLEEKKHGQSMVVDDQEKVGDNVVLRRSKFEMKPSQTPILQPHQRNSARTTPVMASIEPEAPRRTSMVIVQRKSQAAPLISISSLDKGRDEYINQFNGEKIPISESSPIKGDLEEILAAKTGVTKVEIPAPLPRFKSLPRETSLFQSGEKEIAFAGKESILEAKYDEITTKGIVEDSNSFDVNGEIHGDETIAKQKSQIEYKTLTRSSGDRPAMFTINEWTSRSSDLSG